MQHATHTWRELSVGALACGPALGAPQWGGGAPGGRPVCQIAACRPGVIGDRFATRLSFVAELGKRPYATQPPNRVQVLTSRLLLPLVRVHIAVPLPKPLLGAP